MIAGRSCPAPRLGRVSCFAAEITHRGEKVRATLVKRRAVRRNRRQRKTRYRPARFDNRRRGQGWLAPSLNSRLANLLTWVARRGSRQMCRMDRFGFPRTQPKTARTVRGFRTGDHVKAVVTQGKKVGAYQGRVAVRATGSFDITTSRGTVQGISHRSCVLVQLKDGYRYERKSAYSSSESRKLIADL